MTSPLDHGVLNVPLRKRGDIDSQIDAHKRQLAVDAKALRKLRTARVREAHAAIRALPAEHISALAAKAGLNRRQVLKEMRAAAWSNPDFVLAACQEKRQ